MSVYISYRMSGVAAWSIISGSSFFDVLDTTIAAHPDYLDLYVQTDTG